MLHPEPAPRAAAPAGGTVCLFTTPTCPNCRLARRYLDEAGLVYDVVDAEEQPELAASLGIRQAPTLVAEGGAAYVGAGAIKRFLQQSVRA